MNLVFRSKVDVWYYLMVAALYVLVGLLVLPGVSGLSTGAMAGLMTSLAVSLTVPVWFLYSTRYRVTSSLLEVRAGPLLWRIPRADIQSVVMVRSMRAAPALSRHRLDVRYANGHSLMISPDKQAEFLAAIGFASSSDAGLSH